MIDKADATGIGLAFIGHAALLAALLYLIDRTPKAMPSQPAIEVSFVDETGMVSGGETTEPAAASVAPELGAPEDAAPAPDPGAEPAPAPPLPAPSPTPAPSQPQPRAAPQPRSAPTPTPPREQRSARGAAPTSRGSRLGPNFLDGLGSDPARRSDRPSGAVVTSQVRASLDAAILRALLPCQRQALPAPEARSIRVRVEVTLNPNGGLASARVMSVANGNPDLRIYEQRMRDLAVNVVEQCAPIRGLPAEYYNVPRGWRQFRYVFPNS
ncbi:MAG TPA: hypothetical protein VF702_13235 [Allosphingosinicella sp.]|jgi:outer membrane biosynthesis protein TonB